MVVNRRSLTPASGTALPDIHATRRAGARTELTERVTLRRGGQEVVGWTLNASRGGLRVIVEEPLELGDAFDVSLGEGEAARTRPGRVVWVQDEPDGMIVGIEFTDGLSSPPGPASERPAGSSEPS